MGYGIVNCCIVAVIRSISLEVPFGAVKKFKGMVFEAF